MRLNDAIQDHTGKSIKTNGDDGTSIPMTYRMALTHLLDQISDQDADKKYRLFVLAEKINGDEPPEEIKFDASERKLVRDHVGKTAIPLIQGRIWQALDEDEALERAAKAKKDKKGKS